MIGADAVQDAFHDRTRCAADDGRIATGHRVERAVSRAHFARSRGDRLEAELSRDVLDTARQTLGRGTTPGASPGPCAQRAPVGAAHIAETGGLVGLASGLSEQPRKQLVLSSGQRDVEAPAGAAIELRRPTRAAPGPPGQPAVLRSKETNLDELVEMKGCHRPADADRGRGLIAAHGGELSGNVAIEAATPRLENGRQSFNSAEE